MTAEWNRQYRKMSLAQATEDEVAKKLRENGSEEALKYLKIDAVVDAIAGWYGREHWLEEVKILEEKVLEEKKQKEKK